MSVFLTHGLKPFYAGTYFPPKSRYGRPGFIDLLKAIHETWLGDRQKILQPAEKVTAYLQRRTLPEGGGGKVDKSMLDMAFKEFAASYDPQYGGFRGGGTDGYRSVSL